ncbi:HAD-IIB family hydrolase [Mycoplasmopsis gallopavonis]|uniref:COF family HAD hydrolase protein n=1 Tax=Mycoplasmopsis gallopavonis TaxID=76629 RepID=A0A449AYX7_9BACT|nr:HAD family hydrolase [Mycoplasmopsis gallopavonis]RIV16636.1 HAD-IIB family hydrolase [Mycoplasmopsis gallopavonis]VEU72692.1 COF family HAD hydrolase protein [Mycoplasmopsis gallopavonis]
MTQPSIVFLDLDGTTLDGPAANWYTKNPTPFTCEILNKVNSELFPIVIATGRSANVNTARLAKMMGIDTYITWNGAEIIYQGEKIYRATVPSDIAEELFETLASYKLNFVYNSNPREYAFSSNWLSKKFMGMGNKTAKKYSQYTNDFEVQKVMVWNQNPYSSKRLQKLFPVLKAKFQDKLEITLAGDSNNILEITPLNISKGTAELWLCNYLNLDPQRAIHIGDSLNDASTKGKIGKLIAVANAHPDLKNQADEILELSCDQSAVAHYLSQFLKNTES